MMLRTFTLAALAVPCLASVLFAEAVALDLPEGPLACTITQNCDLGQVCSKTALADAARLIPGENGSYSFQMAGHDVTLTEVDRSASSFSLAGSPTRNNTLLLSLHAGGEMAVTIHYASSEGIMINTLRGTCQAETR